MPEIHSIRQVFNHVPYTILIAPILPFEQALELASSDTLLQDPINLSVITLVMDGWRFWIDASPIRI